MTRASQRGKYKVKEVLVFDDYHVFLHHHNIVVVAMFVWCVWYQSIRWAGGGELWSYQEMEPLWCYGHNVMMVLYGSPAPGSCCGFASGVEYLKMDRWV